MFAFVMPSQQEGFGLVYLEAMNYGKACIGCRNDGAEEVIVHEETGLLLHDQHNISELVAALSKLLSDPAWTRSLGSRGFARLHQSFTAEKHQARFQTCIGKILDGESSND
jgi:glycosyltransferase involved in cell wall biosynthesis